MLPDGVWHRFHFDDDHPVRFFSKVSPACYHGISIPDCTLHCVVFFIETVVNRSSVLQELPLLFLRGGSIVPTGPVVQCVGEGKPTDTVTLLVALDKNGQFYSSICLCNVLPCLFSDLYFLV